MRIRTLACSLAGALAFATAAHAATTYTFTAPGGPATYTVPPGVTQLRVSVTGAQGGGDPTCGYGADVDATIPVTPGQVLTLRVGGKGGNPNLGGAAGGYNGGGWLGQGFIASGGGGGGMSDIHDSGGDPFIVAGGGGGVGNGGTSACGGNGGETPQDGSGPTGGKAGTATAGGEGGTTNSGYCLSGSPGAIKQGGNGRSADFMMCRGSGGGGGGYYGGGGGGQAKAEAVTQISGGGGAGSNYVMATATSVVITTNTAGGNGQIVIQPVPTATITTPATAGIYAQGQAVPTAFACASDGDTIATCLDGNGGSGTSGTLDTATVGAHTYTVTATDSLGGTGTASISYTVLGPLTATITTPAGGGSYTQGQAVPTTFTCAVVGGTPVSCVDDNGGSGTSGTLSTATVGAHTYTVTATDKLGRTAKASITYTVTTPASLKLQITGAPKTVKAGATMKVTLTVTNTGGKTAMSRTHATSGVKVCTAIPAGTTVANRGGGTVTNQRICWNVGAVNPGATITRSYTLRTSPTTTTNRTVTLTATAASTDTTQAVARATARTNVRVLAARTAAPTPAVTG